MAREEKPRILRCPNCGKQSVAGRNPFAPFCSERCKLLDLGEWISEGYRISTPFSELDFETLPEKPHDEQ